MSCREAGVRESAYTRPLEVLFVTLGCIKNEVDTDRMRAILLRKGAQESKDPSSADVVIINTCSFLASATQESVDATLELAEQQREGVRLRPIIMCGCVPSRYGDELKSELPEVAAFVRSDEEDGIADVVARVLDRPLSSFGGEGFNPSYDSSLESADSLSLKVRSDTQMSGGHSKVTSEVATPQSDNYPHQLEQLRTVEATSAYVKISEGCDRYCSFCAIPYIRGRYYSRHPEEILAEVDQLLAGGVREIILIGQDTGIWGSDFERQRFREGIRRKALALIGHDKSHGQTHEAPQSESSAAESLRALPAENLSLAWLLQRVAEHAAPYKAWVRVLYLQPEGMTDELIATLAHTPAVLPYIDIPIQHCSERILKRMKRSGSRKELSALFDRLRKEIPHMVLRTTGLIGFPGETDDEFEDLINFIQEQEFDYTSVFMYSREDGTAAAELDEQVPEKLKLERAQIIQDLVDELGFSATASHVGEICDVIIDGFEDAEDGPEFIGHTWFQAPDADGVVHISCSAIPEEYAELSVGDVVRCRLVDSFCYEMIGELLEASSGA